MTIQTWHVHFVIAATSFGIDKVVKCAKDAVRYHLRVGRPIWTEGYDKRFCFDAGGLTAKFATLSGTTNGWDGRLDRGRGSRHWTNTSRIWPPVIDRGGPTGG